MVRKPWRYRWSSAGVHCGTAKDDGLLDLGPWRETLGDEERWRAVLAREIDEDFPEQLREKTQTGRPLGSDPFIRQIERALGRRVRALPVGRPRKGK